MRKWKKNELGRAVLVGGEVLSFAWTAVGNTLDVAGITPSAPQWLPLVGLVIFAMLVAIHICSLEKRLDAQYINTESFAIYQDDDRSVTIVNNGPEIMERVAVWVVYAGAKGYCDSKGNIIDAIYRWLSRNRGVKLVELPREQITAFSIFNKDGEYVKRGKVVALEVGRKISLHPPQSKSLTNDNAILEVKATGNTSEKEMVVSKPILLLGKLVL